MTSITAATPPTLPPALPAARQATARIATRAEFFALGFLSGCWGVHVPSAKAHYQLSPGELSLALLSVALGAVLCLTRAGRLVEAIGPRRAVGLGGVVACLALASILLPSHIAVLALVMLVFGASTALVDVSINAEGSVLEKLGQRKVMSGFHGMWSAGGMAGAGLGGLLLKAGMPPLQQLLLMAVLALVVLVLAQRGMLEGTAVHQAVAAQDAAAADAAQGGACGRRQRPVGLLLLLGALGVSGLLAEGAIYDWCVLWMQQDLGQTQAFAALAYAGFSASMAANRFAGDWLRTHIPAPRLMAVSGVVAAAAMVVRTLPTHRNVLPRNIWKQMSAKTKPAKALVG